MGREVKFRAWVSEQKYMAYQGTPDLETIQSFMFHFGDKELSQFTGLFDVDGKEIFEGDIIQYQQHHFNTSWVVTKTKVIKWKFDKWNVYETNAGECDIKVIGNIFENVELVLEIEKIII
jgi:hypothetical protein